MRPRGEAVVTAVVLALVLGAAGCNRGPAEESVAVAEQALETARPTLERDAPEKWTALRAALDEARGALDEGRYTDALRTAQALPARIHAAEDQAGVRRAGAGSVWEELSRSLPDRLAWLRSRLARSAVATPPPPEDELDRERAALRVLELEWDDARAAFDRGDLAGAVSVAREAATGAEELGERLGGLDGC